ncbi:MAG TPA: 2OG-Fe(II) oxygenase [Caulobacteraceae bacterium]|nr:2OG-Fe(II) oxygenase [Caulobacteraceae bacterium]
MPSLIAEEAFRRGLEAQQAGRYEEAVQHLARAGSEDHVMALSMLGGQLMSGRGVAPDMASGLTLMQRAAELGGDYAWAVLAACACYGMDGDWNTGLDRLLRSAELGYESAQAQLRILADPEGRGPATTNWARLRENIDLDAWRSPPPAEILLSDPDIRTVPGLAPPSVCNWLMVRVRDRMHRALVHNRDVPRETADQKRTNSTAGFRVTDADIIVAVLQERLAAAADMDVRTLEGPQVLHYATGQEYRHHFDFMEPDAPGNAASIVQYGQRVATLLVYLNEGYGGGETDFIRLGLRNKGRAGDALMFRNLDASGAPDRRTLHAGLAVTSGEKWLFSQWVRDRRQW